MFLSVTTSAGDPARCQQSRSPSGGPKNDLRRLRALYGPRRVVAERPGLMSKIINQMNGFRAIRRITRADTGHIKQTFGRLFRPDGRVARKYAKGRARRATSAPDQARRAAMTPTCSRTSSDGSCGSSVRSRRAGQAWRRVSISIWACATGRMHISSDRHRGQPFAPASTVIGN